MITLEERLKRIARRGWKKVDEIDDGIIVFRMSDHFTSDPRSHIMYSLAFLQDGLWSNYVSFENNDEWFNSCLTDFKHKKIWLIHIDQMEKEKIL